MVGSRGWWEEGEGRWPRGDLPRLVFPAALRPPLGPTILSFPMILSL